MKNYTYQTNSYITSIETTIKNISSDDSGIWIELDDTVLFPGGGGQPSDSGWIRKKPVLDSRKIHEAPEYLIEVESSEVEFQIGQIVTVELDWDSRFDRMQQHSGQHLLSAIAFKKLNALTLSWAFKDDICTVDFDRKLTTEEIRDLENQLNADILSNLEYKIFFDSNEKSESRSKSELVGNIRSITIEGYPSNLCCGTHVSCSSQLQIGKVIRVANVTRGSRLSFAFGKRVNVLLEQCLERENEMNKLLKTKPDSFVEILSSKLQKLKATEKLLMQTIKKHCIESLSHFKGSALILHFKDYSSSEVLNIWWNEYKSLSLDCMFFIVTGSKDAFVMTNIIEASFVSFLESEFGLKGNGNPLRGKCSAFNIEALKIQIGNRNEFSLISL